MRIEISSPKRTFLGRDIEKIWNLKKLNPFALKIVERLLPLLGARKHGTVDETIEFINLPEDEIHEKILNAVDIYMDYSKTNVWPNTIYVGRSELMDIIKLRRDHRFSLEIEINCMSRYEIHGMEVVLLPYMEGILPTYVHRLPMS